MATLNPATTIEFRNPNTGADAVVFLSQIFAVSVLPHNKTVAIVGPGGAMLPVAGTLPEIVGRIQSALVTQHGDTTSHVEIKKPNIKGKKKK